MAKKATTGVPTRRIMTDEKDERSYLSRAEREARAQRWVLLGIGAALAVVILVLLAGLVFEGLIYPNQAVAVVNGESIRTADFQAQVRLTRWQMGRQLGNVAALYGAEALTSQDSPFYEQYVMLQPGQEYLVGDGECAGGDGRGLLRGVGVGRDGAQGGRVPDEDGARVGRGAIGA